MSRNECPVTFSNGIQNQFSAQRKCVYMHIIQLFFKLTLGFSLFLSFSVSNSFAQDLLDDTMLVYSDYSAHLYGCQRPPVSPLDIESASCVKIPKFTYDASKARLSLTVGDRHDFVDRGYQFRGRQSFKQETFGRQSRLAVSSFDPNNFDDHGRYENKIHLGGPLSYCFYDVSLFYAGDYIYVTSSTDQILYFYFIFQDEDTCDEFTNSLP